MAPSKRKAKQMRLLFTPLPSSSPARDQIRQTHKERSYATVSLEGKKHTRMAREEDDEGLSLPTPIKSSQYPASSEFKISEIELDENSSDPITAGASTRKRKRPPHQGRLNFANHIGGKLDETVPSEESDMSPNKRPGSARLAAGMFGTQARRLEEEDDETSEEDVLASSRANPSQTQSARKRLRNGTRPGPPASPQRTKTRSGRKAKKNVIELSDDDGSSASEEEPRRTSAAVLDFAEAETSGDDAPALHSSPAKKRKTPGARAIHKNGYKKDDFIVLSSSEEDGSISDVSIDASKRRRRRQHEPDDDEGEEDEDEEPVRGRKASRTPRKFSVQEQEELDEDLEFLQSSPPASRPSRPKKPNPRMEALEALKRKRASQTGAASSSAADSRRSRTRVDSDGGSDDEQDGADTSDGAVEEVDVYASRQRHVFFEDEGDEGFVVEDGPEDTIGAPEMPLWASNISRMKPKDLFKFAVEWMVQKKINPAFRMEDEVYDIAFRKLDDEVRGLAGSKFTSSAWTRDFTTSLQARPCIDVIELGGLMSDIGVEKCAACNRSGHPATYEIQFTGKPYHPETLEELEQDEASDEDDEETVVDEYDSKGRLVPPASKTYAVGRFCKENAMTAHALEHWRSHLYEWVVEHLKEQGHFKPDKIVKRDGWNTKKREKFANGVADEMERVGQVKKLWKDFRGEIDDARNRSTSWRRGRMDFAVG